MLSRVFGPSSLHLADKLAAAAASGTSVNMEACFYHLFPPHYTAGPGIPGADALPLVWAYLEEMLSRVFGPSSLHLADKLAAAAASGTSVNMEACFSQLTLDIIGKAVFNYDFDALNRDSPLIQVVDMEACFSQLTLDIICKAVFNYDFDALNRDSPLLQAVYTSLKETEQRATDLLPLWKFPILAPLIPHQRKALAAVELIRETTTTLIRKCKEMVDEEEMAAAAAASAAGEMYMNQGDPSVLRFLIAAREEVDSTQLRDDLLSMLVAGHETTGSALTWTLYLLAQNPEQMRKAQETTGRELTWTLYLLAQNPEQMRKAQEEVDRVLGSSSMPTMQQYAELKYTLRCVNESMRL
ncbi:hypothetical protein OEZ85_000096 [Tetradesmus obliquus]|uniref:Cytochrome P450 n=1 Tax=Tetradesmus obliquus TaxID=3088 RepID=A0ABY8USK8_TETOB|nr:hypothetical protein OEZ85_000096 [Tetradesmus obliquus]